jgi:hypothetical protein
MEPRKGVKKVRLELERLEDRLTPGTLVVNPVGAGKGVTVEAMPDAAKPGLQTAQTSTIVLGWVVCGGKC